MNNIKFQGRHILERRVFVQAIVYRMLLAYQFKTIDELAEHLDLSECSVEHWATSGRIPKEYILQCNLETGLSMDWLVQAFPFNAMNQFGKNQPKKLAEFIRADLETAVGFRMITEKTTNGLGSLAHRMSTNLLIWVEESTGCGS